MFPDLSGLHINVTEGARRMQRAGRAIVIITLTAFTLCACVAALYTFLPSSFQITSVISVVLPMLFTVMWVSVMALGLSVVLWMGGWILEGFAKRAD